MIRNGTAAGAVIGHVLGKGNRSKGAVIGAIIGAAAGTAIASKTPGEEVVIPQGQTSVTVDVEGGKPGTGSLFLKGYGAGEVTVGVTVTAK